MKLDYELIKASPEISIAKCVTDYDIPDGLILEFGVYTGGSIRTIAANTKRTVFGFDSWEGLPEDWTGHNHGNGGCMHEKGAFKSDKPDVPDNVILVDGWFEDTLPKFLEEYKGKIAFVNIDCDIYSSTKTILDNIKKRVQNGTILLFDELIDYPHAGDETKPWLQHEWKAFQEFLDETGYKYECLGRQHPPTGVAFRIYK